MRITGGGARGIPLRVPRGDAVRPATDRLRQAVASSLGAALADGPFLDLFAGSGSYGLEAWSRGAPGGTFVERDGRTAALLRTNAEAVARSLGASVAALRVVVADAWRWAPDSGTAFATIFVDPPYADLAGGIPALVPRALGWLAPGGVLVVECPGEFEPTLPADIPPPRRLGHGRGHPTALLFRRAVAGDGPLRSGPDPA